jgi:exodeoxyribonuclease VII large subunit
LQRAIEREISARRFAGEGQEGRLRRCAPDFGRLRLSIDSATRTMGAASALHVARHRDAIEGFSGRLAALSPTATLRRGYAIVQRSDTGAVVAAPEDASTGDLLAVHTAGGRLAVEVH